MKRRQFLATSAGIVGLTTGALVFPSTAFAADIQPLTQENWDAAIASGRPIAVRFYETWCPNCTAQGKALNALVTTDARYNDFIVLEAKFGENRQFAAQFGLRQRTSIAIVKDNAVVDAVVGVRSESGLRALLDQAI